MSTAGLINQKQYILDHVFYEFQMYLMTFMELKNVTSLKNQFITNMLIESHQVHLRILIDFFYYNTKYDKKMQKKNDDIIPSEIMPNYTYQYPDTTNNMPDENKVPENIKKAKELINKSITHIAEKRTKDLTDETLKAMSEMFPIIVERITDFLDKLSTTNIAQCSSNIRDSMLNKNISDRFDRLNTYIAYLNSNVTNPPENQTQSAKPMTYAEQFAGSDSSYMTSSLNLPEMSAPFLPIWPELN